MNGSEICKQLKIQIYKNIYYIYEAHFSFCSFPPHCHCPPVIVHLEIYIYIDINAAFTTPAVMEDTEFMFSTYNTRGQYYPVWI